MPPFSYQKETVSRDFFEFCHIFLTNPYKQLQGTETRKGKKKGIQ